MTASIVAAVGLAAVAGGSFLPWVRVSLPLIGPVTIHGTDTAQGLLLVGLGLVSAVAALLGMRPAVRRGGGVLVVAAAAASLAIAATDIVQVLVARVPRLPLPSFNIPEIPTDAPLPEDTPDAPAPEDTPAPEESPAEEGSPEETPPEALAASPVASVHALAQRAGEGSLSVGPGLWVVLAGGVLALVGGLPMALYREPRPAEQRSAGTARRRPPA